MDLISCLRADASHYNIKINYEKSIINYILAIIASRIPNLKIEEKTYAKSSILGFGVPDIRIFSDNAAECEQKIEQSIMEQDRRVIGAKVNVSHSIKNNNVMDVFIKLNIVDYYLDEIYFNTSINLCDHKLSAT